MIDLFSLTVIGEPKPQGSKVAFNAKYSGKAMTKEVGGAGFAAWRNAVTKGAYDLFNALNQSDLDREPLDGALALDVEFRFRMPASRPKSDRLRGIIPKTTAPDTSKLIRLIEDSLQAAGVIKDDARFADVHANKFEVVDGWIGARITIRECYSLVPAVDQ